MTTPAAPKWAQGALRVGLALWAVGSVLLSSALMAFHAVALPRLQSGRDAPTLGALEPGRVPGERWLAVHVLYGDCDCSKRVAAHLNARGPLPQLDEHILLIGKDAKLQAEAEARGFRVTSIDEREAETRYGLKAAPMLLALDPEGGLRWSGGYTDQKRGPRIEDVAILTNLLAGQPPAEKPVFGCATAAALKARLDPLRLR